MCAVVCQFLVTVWQLGNSLAYSEDWCHDTSTSNVYIAAWQEIMKLKVSLSTQILGIVGTEWSGRLEFMCRENCSER